MNSNNSFNNVTQSWVLPLKTYIKTIDITSQDSECGICFDKFDRLIDQRALISYTFAHDDEKEVLFGNTPFLVKCR